MPLLLFGAACLALALYSVVFHTVSLVGRVPLWTYLAGLGGIALAGGIASAVVPEQPANTPHAGDRLAGNLIVVTYDEWLALRRAKEETTAPKPVFPRRGKPVGTTLPAPDTRRVPARPGVPKAAPAPALPPQRPLHTPPEWWAAALKAAQEDGLLSTPTGPPTAGATPDFREVLETLDSISQEAASAAVGTSKPRSSAVGDPPRASGASRGSGGAANSATTRLSSDGEAGSELDALTKELERLSTEPPRSSPSPRTIECAGCGTPVSSFGPEANCESCGRPQCRSCRDRATAEGHGNRCPVCAMLFDAADR